MNYFMLNIALALTWAMLIGDIHPVSLITGFVIGYLILSVARRALGPSPYFGKVLLVVRFGFYFLWELIKSNLRVALDVITTRVDYMKPRIIGVPLDVKTDAEITLLANLISLTPGSLSIDVSTDRRTIYVHVMYAKDAETARREIKEGLERWVLELLATKKE